MVGIRELRALKADPGMSLLPNLSWQGGRKLLKEKGQQFAGGAHNDSISQAPGGLIPFLGQEGLECWPGPGGRGVLCTPQ